MRICLASLHPRILSGQIDSLAGLGRALVRRGHDVTLLAPFDASRLLEVDPADVDAGPRHLLRAAPDMFGAVRRIMQSANRYDVVHLSLPTPAFGLIGDVIQARTNVPLVIGFEGHLPQLGEALAACRRTSGRRTYIPLWTVNNGLFARLSAHLAPAYIVSSRFQQDELMALGVPRDRTTVVPNIVLDSKLEVCDRHLARRQLQLPDSGAIVGYIGHFNDVKGVDVLAEAFALVAQHEPAATLIIGWTGQGDPAPVRRPLERVASSQVRWTGRVHVGTFLSAIDVLALPYRSTAGQGAFPALMLEALYLGCPIVTTDLPLLGELTGAGLQAVVCPPERPDLLAERLTRLLRSAQLRRDISATERSIAQSMLSPDSLAARYESVYAMVQVRGGMRARVA